MLYLVATPIGNLLDISFRAIEVLKSCDYILCEDTRHSRILLSHYAIKIPLKSFHKFNEAAQEDAIIKDLLAGKTIALISDAGTPAISDPGERLVKQCAAKNIPLSPIPGACAAICALICSGFETGRFQFLGFLPTKAEKLKEKFREILEYGGTTILYESPHQLLSTVELFFQKIPRRNMMVCRELTKKFETFYYGSVDEVYEKIKEKPLKGEFVIVIEGNKEKNTDWQELSIEEHVAFMMETYAMSKKEAIKAVAELRGLPKKKCVQECAGSRAI